ncbi:MAG TPA: hypothetical protein P5040_09135, partial [Smithella sp.]|nr:hypothetical protein [Smithella sp.]
GLKSLIFITPGRGQAFSGKPKDRIVQEMLKKHGIDVIYIADRLKDMDIKKESKIFYDHVHLAKQGHKIWAKIIQAELEKIINER